LEPRVKDLSDQFLAASNAVLAFVQRCSDEDWSALCSGENEPLAAVANHIAVAYALETVLISTTLSGAQPPDVYTREGALDQFHAETSRRFAGFSRAETIEHLQENGENTYRYLCQLIDSELDHLADTEMIRRWFGAPVPLELIVKHLVIGHPLEHLRSMQDTLSIYPKNSILVTTQANGRKL
jgi:hypothetical protein